MNESTNTVCVSGRLSGLEMSHRIYGEAFYTFFLECKRLSDKKDVLPVTVSERLLARHPLCNGSEIGIRGQLRSYNKLIGGKIRLYLTVFAREINDAVEPVNEIVLTGYICKPPIYRVTPFGREITDLLVAVNRAFGKSDYIPCIVWGRNARYTTRLEVGDKITVFGRVQSRQYEKMLDGGEKIQRTAYEVSVARLQKTQD